MDSFVEYWSYGLIKLNALMAGSMWKKLAIDHCVAKKNSGRRSSSKSSQLEVVRIGGLFSKLLRAASYDFTVQMSRWFVMSCTNS